nr:hypothetical protein [Actinocrispum wychmicini]
MSSSTWSQSVSCRDAADRPRDIKVRLGAGHDIVVVVPPGEVARLNRDESKLLRAALADAEREHQRRRLS